MKPLRASQRASTGLADFSRDSVYGGFLRVAVYAQILRGQNTGPTDQEGTPSPGPTSSGAGGRGRVAAFERHPSHPLWS